MLEMNRDLPTLILTYLSLTLNFPLSLSLPFLWTLMLSCKLIRHRALTFLNESLWCQIVAGGDYNEFTVYHHGGLCICSIVALFIKM